MTVKNILFVDDEKSLLDGLKRALHPYVKHYNMDFIDSPHEALKIIETKQIDIVVTDYKMPEINGLELLEKVKNLNPGIKRVLLSGQSEKEIFDKSKELVHAYISKPCSSNELIEIINKL